MAKKITPIQRLVEFAMGATEEELDGALQTLKAIRDSRFPSKKAQVRKPRADKGSRRAQTPPPAPEAAAAAASGE